MVLYSPKNCYNNSHKLRTVKDAIILPSPTLGDLKRSYGKDWIVGYISMWLIDLNDNANVKQKMSDGAMEFLAERIYDTYSLKITDLTLFFRNVKEGKYGAYYENLSSEKIMQWIGLYFDERCEYAQMLSQSNHEKFSLTKDKIHPEVAKKLAQIAKSIPVKEIEIVKNGAGSRMKKRVLKTENEQYLSLYNEIKNSSSEKLRDYLLKNNINTPGYNEVIYELAEVELDKKLKRNE